MNFGGTINSLNQIESCRALYQAIFYKSPKALGILSNRSGKTVKKKKQDIRDISVKGYLLIASEATPLKSYLKDWLQKCELNEDETNEHTKLDREKLTEPQLHRENY